MPRAAAPATGLVAPPGNTSRASLAVSASLLLTAVVGGLQSLVLTAVIGAGQDTDAFLGAYSLYLPAALLAITLRGQLIPFFGPNEPEASYRERAIEVASRAIAVGAVVSMLIAAAAPLVAPMVTHGLPPSARTTAVEALLLLAPVAFLQFFAAAISAVLAGSRRFEASAILYGLSSLVSLGGSAAFLAAFGPLGAALGLMLGTLVLAVGHVLYARRLGVRLRLRAALSGHRRLVELAIPLAGYAALSLGQQLNLSIALSAVSDTDAAITLYTLAFYGVLVPLNLSALSLSLVLLPDLVSEVRDRGLDAAREYILRIAPFCFVLIAPLATFFFCAGHPLLKLTLGPILSESQIRLLFELGEVLMGLVLPSFMLQVVVAVAVALRRWRLTLTVGLIGVGLQAVGVALAAGGGALAVAAAHAVVTAVTALLLTAGVFRGATGTLLTGVARALAPAVALSSVIAIGRLAVGGEDSGTVLATCAAATVAYGAAVIWLWPSVGRPLARALRVGGSREASRARS